MSKKLGFVRADGTGIELPSGLVLEKDFTAPDTADEKLLDGLARVDSTWVEVIDAEIGCVALCPTRELAELIARALNAFRTE